MMRRLHWLARPGSIRRLWVVFIAVLTATVIADLVIHRHAYFVTDGTFAFYGWYGFATCVGLILIAKLLGVMLKRKDDYYDQR
ncbi:MAG: hypothetical protein WD823_07335 [Sulfuricaulis sp.]|uniref:hypothetical protein n=1 Tax=Sulfuricaulis sp. TaxID=2003553 RepID=UPI0034A25DAC